MEELDRYVIGQRDAKRMVAIALRNRWRRQQLSPELRDEIVPKNIIMIGPTGVGATKRLGFSHQCLPPMRGRFLQIVRLAGSLLWS